MMAVVCVHWEAGDLAMVVTEGADAMPPAEQLRQLAVVVPAHASWEARPAASLHEALEVLHG